MMAAGRGRGLPELREMLRRQERLLGDRTFLSRLPDRGEKASSFAERLKAAAAAQEEEGGGGRAAAAPQEGLPARGGSPQAPASPGNKELLGPAVQTQPGVWASQTRAKNEPEPARQARGASGAPQGKGKSVSRAPGPPEPVDRSSEALAGALGRISVGGREHEGATESREQPFQSVPQQRAQTPFSVEVPERRAKDPTGVFKPNRIPAEQSGSSHSSPEAPSPGGGHWPLSAEERRRREKQHLDDITAARLPALRHAPAQLLPLEESVALQVQQKAAYEEMQARLAAQKLAQKLGIQMAAYEPEGEVGVRYPEVKDEDGYSSAED